MQITYLVYGDFRFADASLHTVVTLRELGKHFVYLLRRYHAPPYQLRK